MEIVLAIDPLTEFFSAIKSPLTKRNYEKDIRRFFESSEFEGTLKEQASAFTTKAKSDPQWATAIINQFILSQKERVQAGEITDSRVANYYKPIRLFCEENDINLNWKKLARRVPKGRRAANDRAPELQEIKTILTYPDRRIKPTILLMESSGCRIGSFDYLNWGNIEPIEKDGILLAARIKIYAGTNEEYSSFITPECYRAIKEYMDFRKSQGEKINKDSPVIRDLFHPDHLGQGEPHLPKRLKSTGVKRLVEDALKATGLRTTLAKGKKRHDFQADHGFRKWFKSVCERKMKSLHVEILLGHGVGLADNYYRPQDSEMLDEYLKAVPELTILESAPQTVTEDVQFLKERITVLEAAQEKDAQNLEDLKQKFAELTKLLGDKRKPQND